MDNSITINGVVYDVIDNEECNCFDCALKEICERVDGYICLVDLIFDYSLNKRMFSKRD